MGRPLSGSFACVFPTRKGSVGSFWKVARMRKVPSPLRLRGLCFQTAVFQKIFYVKIFYLAVALVLKQTCPPCSLNSPIFIPSLYECFGLRGGRWVLASQSF